MRNHQGVTLLGKFSSNQQNARHGQKDNSMQSDSSENNGGSEKSVQDQINDLKLAQAVDAALTAGATATQAAVTAGTAATQAALTAGTTATQAAAIAGLWAMMVAGFVALTAGIALGSWVTAKR